MRLNWNCSSVEMKVMASPSPFVPRGGTADAVHVVFRVVGNVEIDNQLDVVDIDTARDDVSGDEDVYTSVLELFHHLFTL